MSSDLTEPPHRRTFYGVQVLRGLAAMLVVMVHVTGNLMEFGWQLPTQLFFGNSGVDLFFLISGFVIVWTTQDQWHQPNAWRAFLDKRLTRVLPLYWMLTTAKLVLVLALPFMFRNNQLTIWHAIASYLFIPSVDAVGNINPLIDAGWTLCYEMAFYYVCTICLVFRRNPLTYVTPVLVVLGLVGLVRQLSWGIPASLIDPLLFEFAGGMLLADLTRRGALPRNTALLVALAVLGFAALVASEWLPLGRILAGLDGPGQRGKELASVGFMRLFYAGVPDRGSRVLTWGIPSALILYAFLGLEYRIDFRRFRLPLLLGNASYSIYLAHVMLLPPLVVAASRLSLPLFAEWTVVAVLVVVGAASGVVVWWLVERKIIRVLLDFARPMRGLHVARGTPKTYSPVTDGSRPPG